MESWSLIVSLIAAGVALLLVEIFVPGMILGLIGGLFLFASVITGYIHFGVKTGTLLLAVEAVSVGISMMLWMKYFPKTRMGATMILTETNTSTTPNTPTSLIGEIGKTVTLCRPSCIALIAGKRRDVLVENGFADPDQPVKVNRIEGNDIIVRTL